MAILRIKDENGNWVNIPAIKGEPGNPGEPGADGYTPVRGVDYWTEEDIDAIQGYIDEQLGNVEELLRGV